MSERDFRNGERLLRIINATKVDGKPIASSTLPGTNRNVWQRFQQFIFFSDIPDFEKAGSFGAYTKRSRSNKALSVGQVFVYTLATVLSLWGIARLLFVRPRVLIFSSDRVSDKEFRADFRLHPVYAALKETNTSFFECIHMVINRDFLSNAFKRRRPVMYLEAIDGLWSIARFFSSLHVQHTVICDAADTSGDEKAFAEHVVRKYLGVFELISFRINILKNVFPLAPTLASGFLIDDTRHYHEVSEALRALNVPTYAVQHGHITKYHVGWLFPQEFSGTEAMRPDTFLVWNEYWKREMLRLKSIFPETNIIVAGNPKSLPSFTSRDARRDTALILIPHETDSPKERVTGYIRALAECSGMQIFLKLRPDVSKNETLKEYGTLPEQVEIITNLNELPRKPDVVLGVYSTFLSEMVALHIPVGILPTNMDFGEGLITNGAATLLDSEDLCASVQALTKLSNDERARRATLFTSSNTLQGTIEKIITSRLSL